MREKAQQKVRDIVEQRQENEKLFAVLILKYVCIQLNYKIIDLRI